MDLEEERCELLLGKMKESVTSLLQQEQEDQTTLSVYPV